MQPIEFHKTINNGVIAVPPEHLPLLAGGGATVIVVPDAPQGDAASVAGGLRRHFGAVHGGDPRAADAGIWQAAAHAAEALRETAYDFDAWHEQREFDGEHDGGHLP